LRILSWNINGFTKSNLSTIQAIFSSLNYDTILFQETKSASIPLSLSMSDYKTVLSPSKTAGYGGTLAATSIRPLSVVKGFGLEQDDEEWRTMTLRFDDIYLVNVYFPFAGEKLAKLDSKLKFLAQFERYVKSLSASKPVVICGDLNIAHREIDRTFGSTDMPGFSVGERNWLSKFLASGFVDSFRFVNGDARRYSGYWYGDESKADRLDYFLVSENISARISGADILNDVDGSDHFPITLRLS